MKAISKYSKESIQFLLLTKPKALARAIIAIYKRQTVTEQSVGVTICDNGVGFTGADSYILSSFAVQIKKGHQLTPKQAATAAKRMPKYWKQLIQIAEANDVIRQNRKLAAIPVQAELF